MKPGSLFVLYDDDSVELQYSDGSHLQLSPCGSEFLFEKSIPASAHPLQQPERIRQRTQFAVSSYRDQVLQALEFRNRFSLNPYLPLSTIPPDKITNVLTNISETIWPNSVDEHVEPQHEGSVKVSSLDGLACLYLTKLQQSFTVEFLCRVSQKSWSPSLKLHNHSKSANSKNDPVCDGHSGIMEKNSKLFTPKDNEPEITHNTVGRVNQKDNAYFAEVEDMSPKPFTKNALQCTWVVQQFSVSSYPEEWKYPLSLAFSYYSSQIANETELGRNNDRNMECASLEQYGKERKISVLPKALPIVCDALHLHRWSLFDLISQRALGVEQYTRTGLIKVVLCEGILYRFIHGFHRSVEIDPGDGTVFISQGVKFGKYFTHYKLQEASGKREEMMYAVTNLPPDTPECRYSVCTIIMKAMRVLEHCYKTELSLSHGYEICCWKMVSAGGRSVEHPIVLQQAIIENLGRFSAYSDNRVIANFFDGFTLHMIWNFTQYLRGPQVDTAILPTSRNPQDATTGWCQIIFPDGHNQLIQIEFPGSFESYVKAVIAWCQGLHVNLENKIPVSETEENWSVMAELEKIQRFNFLLEHTHLPSNTSEPKEIEHGGTNKSTFQDDASLPDVGDISSVLEKTSKAIQDIDLLLSSSTRK
ncbi:uncharacterized protein C5orf34 homolog isoform X1 [Pleurodeles waltl]|uniref:uncharacterized protein C5orf34 homolog isoform X1 n=1 Tax=Pleurodeles waltl TaxID=8319 RepID=UPI0037096D73